MDTEKEPLVLGTLRYLRGFMIWVIIGLCLGLIGGAVGAAFSYSIEGVTEFRTHHPQIIWALPLGGLIISWLYTRPRLRAADTNRVLLAIHAPKTIPTMTAPIIFISAVISHLLGASVGREGAALQMGGVLGNKLAKLLHFGEKDTHMVIMCGMSAVFSALFGCPLTAAIFAMEVASVGIIHFSGVVPCLTASLTASYFAKALGVPPEHFPVAYIPPFTLGRVGSVVLIAAVGALVSIFFCVFLHKGEHFFARRFPNRHVRILVGGTIIALCVWTFGTTEYCGAGVHSIRAAVEGEANVYDFAMKLFFTVLAVSAGYKGGEIVPAMFIGSTLGCVMGDWLGLPPGLGAAVGLLSLFCGSLNCPISSMLLGAELFGSAGLRYYAIACAVSFMLSANFGLFKEQKIVYSKISPEFINRYTH